MKRYSALGIRQDGCFWGGKALEGWGGLRLGKGGKDFGSVVTVPVVELGSLLCEEKVRGKDIKDFQLLPSGSLP